VPFDPTDFRLGRTIRRLRRHADISQEALAAWAGVGAKHLGEIERGNHSPTYGTLLRVADGLRMPLSELIAECEREAALPSVTSRRERTNDRAA
jgi:transcriptional regulator with XRE-family HTH domain